MTPTERTFALLAKSHSRHEYYGFARYFLSRFLVYLINCEKDLIIIYL